MPARVTYLEVGFFQISVKLSLNWTNVESLLLATFSRGGSLTNNKMAAPKAMPNQPIALKVHLHPCVLIANILKELNALPI